MNKFVAEELVRQYFQGWLQQNVSLVLGTLSPKVRILECYGPVYLGTDEVGLWFKDWHTGSGKGKVTRWEISKFIYDDSQKIAAVEWDFECTYSENLGSFPGASIIYFNDTKITRIQEYKMEKEQYRPYEK